MTWDRRPAPDTRDNTSAGRCQNCAKLYRACRRRIQGWGTRPMAPRCADNEFSGQARVLQARLSQFHRRRRRWCWHQRQRWLPKNDLAWQEASFVQQPCQQLGRLFCHPLYLVRWAMIRQPSRQRSRRRRRRLRSSLCRLSRLPRTQPADSRRTDKSRQFHRRGSSRSTQRDESSWSRPCV